MAAFPHRTLPLARACATLSAMSSMKYKVKRQLRQMPGNVTVFEADQRDLNRKVEVRVLNQFVGKESDTYLRFEREFKTIARLDHPNVVKVYDWGLADDKIYYVAERRNAAPLEEFLTKGPRLAPPEVIDVGVQIADALAYLHEQQLVHRDIGIESIYYAPEKKIAYVAHFNMVKNLNLEDLTAKGVAQVAPLAFTPERLQKREIDHRTDLFMLAAALYKLLTGEDPLPREAVLMNPEGTFTIRKPSEVGSTLDPRIDDVLLKALAWNPDERFPTAIALKEELTGLRDKLTSRSAGARRTGATAAAPAQPKPPEPAPRGDEMPSIEVSRGALPTVAAAQPPAEGGPGEVHLRALGLGPMVERFGAHAVWGMVTSTVLVVLLLFWLLL